MKSKLEVYRTAWQRLYNDNYTDSGLQAQMDKYLLEASKDYLEVDEEEETK